MTRRESRQMRRRLNLAARRYAREIDKGPPPLVISTTRRTLAIARYYGPAAVMYLMLVVLATIGIVSGWRNGCF